MMEACKIRKPFLKTSELQSKLFKALLIFLKQLTFSIGSLHLVTAMIGHLLSHFRTSQARFSYWRSPRNKEVDLVVEVDGIVVPFEVKYQAQTVQKRDVPGLIELAGKKPAIVDR